MHPFSSDGAQLNNLMLFVQIVMYSFALLILLNCCRAERVPKEPGVVQPEQDDYAVPAEVTNEEQRVGSLINGQVDASNEAITVHKLVKRYYTKGPEDDGNSNARGDDRPSLQNEEGFDEPQRDGEVGFNAVKGTSFSVQRG